MEFSAQNLKLRTLEFNGRQVIPSNYNVYLGKLNNLLIVTQRVFIINLPMRNLGFGPVKRSIIKRIEEFSEDKYYK